MSSSSMAGKEQHQGAQTATRKEHWAALERELEPVRERVLGHRLYASLDSLESVRVFMEHHVFAVWDFMSLLKGLQRQLTCVEVPWVPRGTPEARRLINEIVLEEETDEGWSGGFASHFELYLGAMRECGADTSSIESVVGTLQAGGNLAGALEAAPAAARRFVEHTFATLDSGSLPRVAAAFTLGREKVIPDMFTRLVADISAESGGVLGQLHDYFERHIQLDGEVHGPMAERMLVSICGDDEDSWSEAQLGAHEALAARALLWDGVLEALEVVGAV